MHASTIIIIFIIVAILSLVAVSFVNQQQTRRRVVSSRVHALRRRIIELEEIANAIEPLVENVILPKFVNDEILSIADTILRLDPNATYILPIKDTTTASIAALSSGKRSQALNRALSSDSAIAKNQFYLKETANIVRKQHANEIIDTAQLDSLIKELTWAKVMVEVISIIGQGHIAMEQSNVLKAYSYYKRAQQILSAANFSDPRRDQFIRELSEMQANNRRSLSPSIMPETHLNPKKDPHAAPTSPDENIDPH